MKKVFLLALLAVSVSASTAVFAQSQKTAAPVKSVNAPPATPETVKSEPARTEAARSTDKKATTNNATRTKKDTKPAATPAK